MSAAVRAGYKQTEVGVIPEDWNVANLQKVCAETITYGIVQCGPHIGNGVPYIRVSDMNSPSLDVAGMLRTSQAIASQFSRSQVKEGDVVYALRGKIGEVRIVDHSVSGANLTQGTARLSPSNRVDSTYLLYCLRSQRALRQGDLAAKGSTFREITLEALRQIELPIAPLPEQRAIAAALSDVDALLAKLDALIAKKRDLKVAAMQQLLTGQTRLPGFRGEWEVKRLGDIANLYQPVTISAKQFTASGYPVYGANGVVGSFGEFNHESPQVTVTCRGSTCGTVNRTVARSWITGNAMVVNCDQSSGLNKDFLYYLLLNQDLSICITGSGQPQIVRGPLANFELPLPSDLTEQTAIATVLSDVDAELVALEARRDKTRALKQGMMQVLLTGHIRLV